MIKMLLYPLLTMLVLVSLCIHTKPAPERHIKEVSEHVTNTLRNYSHEGIAIPEKIIGRIEADSVVYKMLENNVVINDYPIFSLCKVVVSSDEYFLSVGILDRILILPKEEIAEMLFLKLREKKIVD